MAAKFEPKTKAQITDIIARAADPEFVSDCEKAYAARIAETAQKVVESGARVVLLTGPSSSGKTTTARKLRLAIQTLGKPTVTLSLDDFLRDAVNYPKLPDGTVDYESDETLDMPLFNKAVNEILSKGSFDCPTYDWEHRVSVPGERVEAEPGSIIIAEGIHALNPKASCDITAGRVFKIYASLRTEFYEGTERIISTRELRIVRRLLRDAVTRSTPIEDTLEMWKNIVRGEELYIKPNKKYADHVIDTSFLCEVPVFLPDFTDAVADPANGGKYRETLEKLYAKYALFPRLPEELLPEDSMLREFLGGLCLPSGN